MLSLTAEEVQTFSQRIKLSPRKDDQSTYDYLNEIIHSFQENIPFQNVILLATPVEKRRRPTWDKVKEDLLSGQGGLCYSLNQFFHIYLNALGYKTDLVLSTYGSPNDHTVIIVNSLVKEEDKFMVDVGSGYASFIAIPLDFQDESPYYSFSYTVLKLKWDENKQNIIRIHKSASTDVEKPILKFNLQPITDYILDLSEQERIFTDPSFTPFHKIICIITFNRDGARILEGKQFARENITTHKIGNEGEELNDVEEYVKKCVQEYPTLNQNNCRLAYNHLFSQTK